MSFFCTGTAFILARFFRLGHFDAMTRTKDHEISSARTRRRKPITRERIRNWALGYLGRFAATEAHLLVVLERKIKRHLDPEAEETDLSAWIEVARQTARDMVDLGIVNDRLFAEARVRSLHTQGKSRRAIVQKLAAKGVASDDIEAAFTEFAGEFGEGVSDEVLDLEAAVRLARRRRIGPFRRGEVVDERQMRREFGVMARAGFGYAVARRVLNAENLEELENLLAEVQAEGAVRGL